MVVVGQRVVGLPVLSARWRQEVAPSPSRLTPETLFYDRHQQGQDAVSDSFDRLKTALADRYAIEREIGAGSMATVSRPSVAYTPAPLAGTPSWIHLWD